MVYGNTYAVHVTVALVGVATLNLASPAPLVRTQNPTRSLSRLRKFTPKSEGAPEGQVEGRGGGATPMHGEGGVLTF